MWPQSDVKFVDCISHQHDGVWRQDLSLKQTCLTFQTLRLWWIAKLSGRTNTSTSWDRGEALLFSHQSPRLIIIIIIAACQHHLNTGGNTKDTKLVQRTCNSSGCDEKHCTRRLDWVPRKITDKRLLWPSTALISILKQEDESDLKRPTEATIKPCCAFHYTKLVLCKTQKNRSREMKSRIFKDRTWLTRDWHHKSIPTTRQGVFLSRSYVICLPSPQSWAGDSVLAVCKLISKKNYLNKIITWIFFPVSRGKLLFCWNFTKNLARHWSDSLSLRHDKHFSSYPVQIIESRSSTIDISWLDSSFRIIKSRFFDTLPPLMFQRIL